MWLTIRSSPKLKLAKVVEQIQSVLLIGKILFLLRFNFIYTRGRRPGPAADAKLFECIRMLAEGKMQGTLNLSLF
ncbi:MAG TPA: hypothetical protein DCO79_04575 [Spirochaeta sp.]|nr:hypothetical protein [Spirochaeta sp.]